MKLSRCQARTLRRLEEEYKADPSRWFTGHSLAESEATLKALAKQGLVEVKPKSDKIKLPPKWRFYRHKVTA